MLLQKPMLYNQWRELSRMRTNPYVSLVFIFFKRPLISAKSVAFDGGFAMTRLSEHSPSVHPTRTRTWNDSFAMIVQSESCKLGLAVHEFTQYRHP